MLVAFKLAFFSPLKLYKSLHFLLSWKSRQSFYQSFQNLKSKKFVLLIYIRNIFFLVFYVWWNLKSVKNVNSWTNQRLEWHEIFNLFIWLGRDLLISESTQKFALLTINKSSIRICQFSDNFYLSLDFALFCHVIFLLIRVMSLKDRHCLVWCIYDTWSLSLWWWMLGTVHISKFQFWFCE